MRICKEILKISTFVGIFCMFCPLCTCILQFYVSLNCYMPKCVSYFPFSCGTLQKSKNWFDVLNFGFSHIHGYSGSTVIRDSRVKGCHTSKLQLPWYLGLLRKLRYILEIPHFSHSSSCRTENAETAVLIIISY